MNSERIARDVITIGASSGGVKPLLQLLSFLPKDLQASVAVVIHRSPIFKSCLAELASARTQLSVVDATDGAPVERGRAYIAPADFHLIIQNARFRLERSPRVHFTRPAVDPLFWSAASSYGPRVVGVLLSGNGTDGVSGLIAIKAMDGLSIVQDPSEAAYPSMPAHGIEYDHIDATLPIESIATTLKALVAGHSVDPATNRTEKPPGKA